MSQRPDRPSSAAPALSSGPTRVSKPFFCAPKAEGVVLPPDSLLKKYDKSGPRYTSYPTADRFVEAFGADDYAVAMAERARGLGVVNAPLSLYVHIPFCQSLCYYCACNKIVTKHQEKSAPYLELLLREIDMHARMLKPRTPLVQLHLGGGTPTFFTDEELTRLWNHVAQTFALAPNGEYGIEVDPRTVNPERLAFLSRLGFNRISLGVQDFDAAVQKAVHRLQPHEEVAQLMRAARDLGFESINMDLIYGLPLQSAASLARTLEQVITLRPDRIALYSYAHLPQRFKPQRRIQEVQLPLASEKTQMFRTAMQMLCEAGYDYIGMDHFALPDDSLAAARRQGRLHRNFQGYSTQAECDLIAVGVSAIGKVGATYSQNAKTLEEYADLLAQNQLPIVRGMTLSHDDMLRRSVIMAIMCQGYVSYEAIELAWLLDFKTHFAREMEQLETLAKDGLLTLADDGFSLTPNGWLLVRAVAMVFDKYLQSDLQRVRYSRII